MLANALTMNWTLLSIILAVIFSITTIILALKLAKKKKPVWALHTRKIMGIGTDSPAELKMTFRGLAVDDVYRTKFIFLNKGTETIRKADVAEAVTIHFEGATILDQPTALARSKQANELSVRQIIKDGDKAVEVDFLYLDHDDGALVEVLHTKSERIRCSGIIMGAGDIDYIGEFLRRPPPSWFPIMLVVFFTLFGCMIYSMWNDFARWVLTTQIKYLFIIPTIFTLFLTVYLGRYMVRESPVFYRYLRFPRWTGLHTRKGVS